MKPDFFVLGTKKSGTTWLSECLNYHPEILCFNELQVQTIFKSNIVTLLNQANNASIGAKKNMFNEFYYPVVEFNYSDALKFIDLYWDIVVSKHMTEKTKFYGEKEPDYASSLENIIQHNPKAKFIHIVRNPKDCAISYYYHTLRGKKLVQNSENLHFLSTATIEETKLNININTLCLDSITVWKRDQSMVESMKKRFPKRFLTVRYEDMNPKNLNSIYEFIGAKSSEELSQNILNITNVNNRKKDKNSFIKFGKSNNWRELDPELIEKMNSVLSIGDWLGRYGYE